MTPETSTGLYLTTAEASLRYPVTKRTLMLWREKRRGPRYYRIGKSVFYKVTDLEAYFNACAVWPNPGVDRCPPPATPVLD